MCVPPTHEAPILARFASFKLYVIQSSYDLTRRVNARSQTRILCGHVGSIGIPSFSSTSIIWGFSHGATHPSGTPSGVDFSSLADLATSVAIALLNSVWRRV